MGPRRALISVSDKAGLLPFAQGLTALGFEIISTGGTARVLKEAGIPVSQVSDVTRFPEILDGRVKSLHPKIFAGILARRGHAPHEETLREHGIAAIDLVAVNLYPFEEKAHDTRAPMAEAVELIDIGGPALIRSAAKNHEGVLVVVDPSDYPPVLDDLRRGQVAAERRAHLAAKAFAHTARYDAFVAHYFHTISGVQGFPPLLNVPLRKREDLRYGENHHQSAAFYDDPLGVFGREPGAATYRQLHGKPLSYNNLLDADAALEALKEFTDPTVVIVKHMTPSGIASSSGLVQAWEDAYATDTYSPFGGVVACNRTVSAELAKRLGTVFLELVLAPSYEPDALALLQQKKNLRVLQIPGLEAARAREGWTLRTITGGVLLQDRDTRPFDPTTWNVVTKRKPTPGEMASLLFAAKCAKHVKSNSIVFTKGTRTVGIGGGQTARVDAIMIASFKGKQNIQGSVMGSEAFFPFRDSVDAAAKMGVTAIVQPGGSIRDHEVTAAADEHGIAMVMSGHRSFRH